MTAKSDRSIQKLAAGAATDFGRMQRRVFPEAGIDPRSRFVDVESPRLRIHVLEAGDLDGDEPPTLFVHGGGAFGAMFAPLMAHLDGTGMIAIDRPGNGLSGDFTYTAENHRQIAIDVLVGVLDELGIAKVDLVGNSAGGYWSIVFALAHPSRVRRLILLGSVPTFPGTRPPVPLRLFTVPVVNRLLLSLQETSEKGVVERFELFGEGETVREYPALIRANLAQDRNPRSADVGIAEFQSFLTLRGWHPATRLREEELRQIQRSTLFIWGENDPLGGPRDVRASVEMIPDARLETVDAGHLPWFGHPATCARSIRGLVGPETTDPTSPGTGVGE